MKAKFSKFLAAFLFLVFLEGVAMAQNAALECRLQLVPLSLNCLNQDELREEVKKRTDVFIPETQIETFKKLEQLKSELDKREATQQKQNKELRTVEERIERKLNELQALRAQIEEERQARIALDEKDISKLVTYYEKMEPEKSAEFINKMDPNTASHILMRINPRKGSKIMELLDAKVAVEITESLAGFKRNIDEAERASNPNTGVQPLAN